MKNINAKMQQIVANLAGTINLTKVAFFFDVDGCLTNPNDHALTEKQTKISKRLLILTGGAVTLFTDNDMRIIQPHMPHMPIISEGGGVALLDGSGDLNNAEIMANIQPGTIANINAVAEEHLQEHHPDIAIFHEHSNTTNSDRNRIVIEAKQTRAGLNWGGGEARQHFKNAALKATEHALKELGLSDVFEIQANNVDCVEITPREFTKPERIIELAKHERFDGCKPIMFGDSPIDSEAGKQVGAMIAIGDRFDNADHILQRFKDPDELWEFLEALCDYYEENPHINATRQTFAPKFSIAA